MAAILGLSLVTSIAWAADVSAASWVSAGKFTPQAQEVLTILRRVEDFGLDPGDFATSLAILESAATRSEEVASIDAAMNAAALRLIQQLHRGRVDPKAAGYALRHQRAAIDDPEALRRLAAATDVRQTLADFEPQSAQYRALKQTLARYHRLPPGLELPPGVRGSSVREGDAFPEAAALRGWLVALGDLHATPTDSPDDPVYDADLAAAVANFQRRHGLTVDGVLGPRTLLALTVPIARRIRQIELTMERWRWIPDINAPAVIVNVPQFMLYTLADPALPDGGVRVARIPVIVGQTVRQTPVFDSVIESVIFRPFWNVPDSILREELLPLIERDPAGYLARHDMEIVRGEGDDAQVLRPDAESAVALRRGTARLRQRPGPDNSLGRIKFVLPNPYSVYLHATPETQLFSRERRALSHGCIRVSDAEALAAYLLNDGSGRWTPAAIEAATCGTETFSVRLSRPVPVFILYGTVVVDPDGSVLFFDDVYGYDRKLDALLAAARIRGYSGR